MPDSFYEGGPLVPYVAFSSSYVPVLIKNISDEDNMHFHGLFFNDACIWNWNKMHQEIGKMHFFFDKIGISE